MRQVRGTESIFYIKHEGIWCPVACETSSGMSEQTEMISTTTRDNEGWKTEKPTLQGYSISVSGALVNELPSMDYYGRNLLKNSKVSKIDGWFAIGSTGVAAIQNGELYVVSKDTFHGAVQFNAFTLEKGEYTVSYELKWADNRGNSVLLIGTDSIPNSFSEPLPSLANNEGWIKMSKTGVSSTEGLANFVIQGTGGIQHFYIRNIKFEKGTFATPYSIAPEEQKILSYFKLRQKKRNRELIEWKRETLGGRYIDSGRAHITDISDENPVDDMMAFTMTLSGFGKPDFVADDSIIVAEAFANYNDDLVANSNNQILEP